MQTNGTINVSSSEKGLIPLALLNQDPLNPIIRANKVAFSFNIPEGYNGILKFYDIVYDQTGNVPFWLSPIREYPIVDGKYADSGVVDGNYDTWISPQEVWSLVVIDGSNTDQISINYTLTFPYPAQIPEQGDWLSYTDPQTGYALGLIKFTADGKIDLNGKTLINQG